MTNETREFSVLGKSVPRVNGSDKARGRTQFVDDISLPGMVYGRLKRSDVVHARIKKNRSIRGSGPSRGAGRGHRR